MAQRGIEFQKKILIFIIFLSTTLFAGEFTVDTIYRQCFEFSSSCAVPVVRGSTKSSAKSAELMNKVIDERFMGILDTSEECRWTDLEFSSDSRNGYLWIEWTGTYYGPYDVTMTEVIIFDEKSGISLTCEGSTLPLFDLKLFLQPGSFSYVFPFWADSCRIQQTEAYQCAEESASCSCDEPELMIEDSLFIASLGGDCYPRVMRACSPYLSQSVPIPTIVPYLNNMGKALLVYSDFLKQDAFGRYLLYKSYVDSVGVTEK